MPFERTDMQNFNCVSADQCCAAQYTPASSHVSSVAYGGESSVSPIPSDVPSGFVQTAPFTGVGESIAQPAQGPHGSGRISQGSDENDDSEPQASELSEGVSSAGGQPQIGTAYPPSEARGESKPS